MWLKTSASFRVSEFREFLADDIETLTVRPSEGRVAKGKIYSSYYLFLVLTEIVQRQRWCLIPDP